MKLVAEQLSTNKRRHVAAVLVIRSFMRILVIPYRTRNTINGKTPFTLHLIRITLSTTESEDLGNVLMVDRTDTAGTERTMELIVFFNFHTIIMITF